MAVAKGSHAKAHNVNACHYFTDFSNLKKQTMSNMFSLCFCGLLRCSQVYSKHMGVALHPSSFNALLLSWSREHLVPLGPWLQQSATSKLLPSSQQNEEQSGEAGRRRRGNLGQILHRHRSVVARGKTAAHINGVAENPSICA